MWDQHGEEQDIRAARPDRRYYPTDHPCAVPDGHASTAPGGVECGAA
jgi:hypothetical protein